MKLISKWLLIASVSAVLAACGESGSDKPKLPGNPPMPEQSTKDLTAGEEYCKEKLFMYNNDPDVRAAAQACYQSSNKEICSKYFNKDFCENPF